MTTTPIPILAAPATAPIRHPGDALTASRRAIYVLVLGVLVALGPFTVDLYLPAFPAVQADLGVSAAAIQFTLAGTVIGFGLGQLVVGPWSDRVGRRVPLLVTTGVHIGTCLLAAAAPDIVSLATLRVLMGAGAAGGGVVATAIVRDLFGGQPLVRMLARLGLVSGAAPILAPVIGSQLLRWLDWRGLFVALAIYGAAGLAFALVSIGETLPHAARSAGGRSARSRYRAVFGDRVFVGIAILGGMQFAGLFAYLSSSSFLFQERYGFTAQQYGLLFAINSVGVIAGSQASALIMRRIGPQWILAITTLVQAVSAATIVLVGVAGAPLPVVLVPLWIFIAACGFGFPCVQVIGLVNHGDEAGTAASVLGAVNFGLAGLLSPVIGALGVDTARPMGVVMAATAVVSLLALWLVVRPKTVPAILD